MKIIELFPSIQGESTLQGLPCVFVRLSGCNLNCSYCDTRYARTEGTEVSIKEILKKVLKYKIPYACITGGEPLLQHETPELAAQLLIRGCRVSVETNGTFDVLCLPRAVTRIIDIKCPGSGEKIKLHRSILSRRRLSDEFKFVLTDRRDFEFARDFVKEHKMIGRNEVLFSPVRNSLSPTMLSEWLISELPEARLNIQIHRCIWPNESRGR